MSLRNYTVSFFAGDKLNHGGYTSSRRVNAASIERAVLQWSISAPWFVLFQQIKFNGSPVAGASNSMTGSADVTSLVQLNRENTVELLVADFNFFQASTVTVDLLITALPDQISTNPAPTKGFSIPNWVYLVLVGVVIVLLVWFFFFTPRGKNWGGKAVSAAYGTAKDVAGVVAGSA